MYMHETESMFLVFSSVNLIHVFNKQNITFLNKSISIR